jgi:hypothetical protein
MKARVEQRHVFRAIGVQLSPLGSRAVLPEDRIDVEQIGPTVDPRTARDGDRHTAALIVRAQHVRIAGDKAIFHWIDAIRVLG